MNKNKLIKKNNHSCFDCMHYDGGNCLNNESNYYKSTGNIDKSDCMYWENNLE